MAVVRTWVSKSTQVSEQAQGCPGPLLQTREPWHHWNQRGDQGVKSGMGVGGSGCEDMLVEEAAVLPF